MYDELAHYVVNITINRVCYNLLIQNYLPIKKIFFVVFVLNELTLILKIYFKIYQINIQKSLFNKHNKHNKHF